MTQNNHLFSAFAESAQSHAKKIALVIQEEQGFHDRTFQELYEKTLRFGSYLKEQGIGPGDKVAIFLDNGEDFVTTFFGIMFADATAVLLDIQYTPTQVKNLMLHSEAKAIILSHKNYDKIGEVLHNAKLIALDSSQGRRDIQAARTQPFSSSADGRKHVAVLFYTSGTTDAPKAVMLSHDNLLSNVDSIKELNLLQGSDRVISFLPLHHAYAFTVTLLCPLFLGGAIVYPKTLSASELLRCVRESKTTIFVGVPRVFELMYRSIMDKLKMLPPSKRMLANGLGACGSFIDQFVKTGINKKIYAPIHQAFGNQLRFLISGGAKLDPEIGIAYVNWGFTILEGYGLTETSPVATFAPPKRPKMGSVGKPLKSVHVKIDLPNKEGIGEVAIKGPNVMMGYYNMSEETAAAVRDGWFYSGDLGYLDNDGYLFLVGRRKEIIVLSNGENLNPEEIERHYQQNVFFKEIGVLAKRDASRTEQLVAVVVADDDRLRKAQVTNMREKLKWELENLSAKLATYKRIKGFVISQEPLPRTRLGKLKRFKLDDIYDKLLEPAELSRPETAAQKEDELTDNYHGISNTALSYLEETFKRPVQLKDHLELDLGLDSLSRIELLMNLQERLKLNLDAEQSMEFFMCGTIEELLNKMKEHVPSLVEQFKKDKPFDWSKQLNEPLQEATRKKIKLNFGFLAIAFNVVMITIFKVIFKIFFLLKSEGRKNLPEHGPYLICPNHTSYLDGLFILCALPYKQALQTYFVGYSTFFESSLLRHFIKVARLIPLATNVNLVEALKASVYCLRQKKIVCYFPEGQRSIDGRLNEFKKGVSILLKEFDVPVIPVYMEGAIKTWSRTQHYPHPARVTVKFGAPTNVAELGKTAPAEATQEAVYEQIARNLREHVSRLGQMPLVMPIVYIIQYYSI